MIENGRRTTATDDEGQRMEPTHQKAESKYQIRVTFDPFNTSVYEKNYKLLKYGIETISSLLLQFMFQIGKCSDAIWVHLIIVQNPIITMG